MLLSVHSVEYRTATISIENLPDFELHVIPRERHVNGLLYGTQKYASKSLLNIFFYPHF